MTQVHPRIIEQAPPADDQFVMEQGVLPAMDSLHNSADYLPSSQALAAMQSPDAAELGMMLDRVTNIDIRDIALADAGAFGRIVRQEAKVMGGPSISSERRFLLEKYMWSLGEVAEYTPMSDGAALYRFGGDPVVSVVQNALTCDTLNILAMSYNAKAKNIYYDAAQRRAARDQAKAYEEQAVALAAGIAADCIDANGLPADYDTASGAALESTPSTAFMVLSSGVIPHAQGVRMLKTLNDRLTGTEAIQVGWEQAVQAAVHYGQFDLAARWTGFIDDADTAAAADRFIRLADQQQRAEHQTLLRRQEIDATGHTNVEVTRKSLRRRAATAARIAARALAA